MPSKAHLSEWLSMNTGQKRAAAIAEAKRIAEDGVPMSTVFWNRKRRSDLPTWQSVSRLFETWNGFKAAAGVDQDNLDIEEMDKRAILAEERAPLRIVVADDPKPHTYYCTTRRRVVTATVLRGAEFDRVGVGL